MVLAFWVAGSTVVAIRERLGMGRSWRQIPRGFWGMITGHLGIAVFIVGVTLTSLYSTEKDVRLAPGESYSMGGYSFEFEGVDTIEGPNYTAYRGNIIARQDGEFVAIMGPSGCGKSTFLHIAGMLDNPSNGEYFFMGEEVSRYSEKKRANLRKGNIGFVFQSFNLIDELTIF